MTAPGRHARQPRPDLPWRRRPRPPLNLRDGGTARVALFVVVITGGLVGEGFNAMIGDDKGGVWLGIGMLVIGLALLALEIAYVNRPPYR